MQQFRPAFARPGLRRGSVGCPCTFRRTYIVLRVRKGRHRSRMGNKCLPCGGLRIHGGRKRLRIAWHNRHLLHAGFSALGPRRQWIRCRHPQRLGLGHGVGARRGLRVGDLRLRGHSRGRGCLTRGRLLAHKAQALHHAVAIGQLRTTAAPQSLTGGRPRLLRKGWTRRERHGQGRSRKVRGRCYRPLASASRPHGKGPGSGRKSQAAEALGHARRVRRQRQELNWLPGFKGKLQAREPPCFRSAVFTEHSRVGLHLLTGLVVADKGATFGHVSVAEKFPRRIFRPAAHRRGAMPGLVRARHVGTEVSPSPRGRLTVPGRFVHGSRRRVPL